MDKKELKKEDFSYTANSRGYMLMYKGLSIGGTGLFTGGIATTGTLEDKQTQKFVKSAEIDIQNIMFGNPGHYGTLIDEINKEM